MNDAWGYDDMLADIENRNRFAFVRYSDGDWNCFFGRDGGIPNEHAYMPGLGQRLRESVVPEPGYHVGIMPSLLTPDRWWASNKVISWLADRPEMSFCSSLVLHKAGMQGRLDAYFSAVKGQRRVLISNESASGMAPWLGDFEHVIIPKQDCWLQRDEILPRIIKACREPGVAMFACSIPAKVWIRQAWDAGCAASLIDIGSVFDPYLGRLSRNYMRKTGVILAEPLYEVPPCT